MPSHGKLDCLISFSKRRIYLLPQTCTLLADEGNFDTLGSSSNQVGGIIASNHAKDYRTLWIVHGTCATLAWAILVPLAIGSLLLRHFIGNVFPQNVGLWFELHRALNILAILLTIIALLFMFKVKILMHVILTHFLITRLVWLYSCSVDLYDPRGYLRLASRAQKHFHVATAMPTSTFRPIFINPVMISCRFLNNP
jgi:hypothetical protein